MNILAMLPQSSIVFELIKQGHTWFTATRGRPGLGSSNRGWPGLLGHFLPHLQAGLRGMLKEPGGKVQWDALLA